MRDSGRDASPGVATLRSELWSVENMRRLPFYHLSQANGNVVECTRQVMRGMYLDEECRSKRAPSGRGEKSKACAGEARKMELDERHFLWRG